MGNRELEEIDLGRVVVAGGEGPVERFVNTVTGQPTGGDSWAHRFARDVDVFFNLR